MRIFNFCLPSDMARPRDAHASKNSYPCRESLNRNYFVHVHVYKSGIQNVILTVAVYQRELDSLQSIAAWKISKLLESRKKLDKMVLLRAIPTCLKQEIERYIFDD